ncbi:MAG: hypothetical protein HY719_13480 [Planctomycetes bacterium]|nr:hypothetical protein [Planctomycetota bacterium]
MDTRVNGRKPDSGVAAPKLSVGTTPAGAVLLLSVALLSLFALACGLGGGSAGGDLLAPPKAPPPFTVTTPTTFQTGDVKIYYDVIGPESSRMDVRVEYSTDGGKTWLTATERAGAPSQGTTNLLAGPAPGISHTYVWNSAADLAGKNSPSVKVRVTQLETSSTTGGKVAVEGSAKESGAFIVNNGPPSLTGVTPGQATSGRETEIVLSGSALSGAGVEFQNSSCAKTAAAFLRNASDTALTATVPATLAVGWYRIVLTTPAGTTEVTPCQSNLALVPASEKIEMVAPPPPPVVNSVSPASADNLTTVAITVTGSRFTGVTAAELSDGTNSYALTNLNVTSDTSLTATVQARQVPVGVYGVYVTGPGGKNPTTGANFTVQRGAPVVDAVSPSSGANDVATNLSISGINFTGATAVEIRGATTIPLTSVNVSSDTLVTATVPAGQAAGVYNVVVTTPVGASAAGSGSAYTVTTPGPPPPPPGGGTGSTNDDEVGKRTAAAGAFAWKSLSAIPSGGTSEVAVEDSNGVVYLLGGYRSSGAVKDVTRFDPASDTYSNKAMLATARGGAGAVRSGTNIYVIGGHDGAAALKSVEVFDASKEAMGTAAADLSTARNYAAAAIVDGKIYVFGGASSKTSSPGTILASAEKYDPATNKWTAIKALPSARWAAMATSTGGKVYLFGGKDSAGKALKETQVYDPATDAYTKKKDSVVPRAAGVAAPYDGKVFILGGEYQPPAEFITTQGNTIETNIVQVYDPAADSWGVRPSMLTPSAYLGGTICNGYGYLFGGLRFDFAGTANELLSKAGRFDPLTISGTSAASPSNGSGGGAAGANDLKVSSVGIGFAPAQRDYRVWAPKGYVASKAYPLVVWCHGSGMRSTDLSPTGAVSELTAIADRDGVLVAAPQALTNGAGQWGIPGLFTFCIDGRAAAKNFDIQFVQVDMLTDIKAKWNVDTKRIAIAGLSNGGFFATLAGTHNGQVWSSFVSIAGGDWNYQGGATLLGAESVDPSKASVKTPAFYVHGDADATVNVNSTISVRDKMLANGWDGAIAIAHFTKGGDHFQKPPFMLHAEPMWKFMQNHSLP